jgi:hypothetical protein
MAATHLSMRRDTHLPMGQMAGAPVIRLIPGMAGANVKVIYKCEIKPAPLPIDNGKQSYRFLANGAVGHKSTHGIPFSTTFFDISIPSPAVYDDISTNPLQLNDAYHQLDNSPQHSYISTDGTSICDDFSPTHPSNTPPCDNICTESGDPIDELMNLDFPDLDCSLSFADLLSGDNLWDIPNLEPSCESVTSETNAMYDSNSDNKVGKSGVRGDRVEKKRNSNRHAALRYRERKRLKKQGFECMLDSVKIENDRLRAQLFAEYQSVALLIDLAKGML